MPIITKADKATGAPPKFEMSLEEVKAAQEQRKKDIAAGKTFPTIFSKTPAKTAASQRSNQPQSSNRKPLLKVVDKATSSLEVRSFISLRLKERRLVFSNPSLDWLAFFFPRQSRLTEHEYFRYYCHSCCESLRSFPSQIYLWLCRRQGGKTERCYEKYTFRRCSKCHWSHRGEFHLYNRNCWSHFDEFHLSFLRDDNYGTHYQRICLSYWIHQGTWYF